MLAHEVGIAQTEGGMVVAQPDEVLVVGEDLGVGGLAAPVDVVDLIGRLEAVVYTLLVAQHLFAGEHEGHSLRGEDSGLCEQVKSDELGLGDAGDAGLETVDEAHIVVAGDVGDHLRGFCGPGRGGVVHLRHVDLRVGDTAGNAVLEAFLIAGDTTDEGCLLIVGERTAEGIADLVAEGGDTWHLRDVGLHAELFLGIGTGACAPAFAVDEDGGVDGIDHRADLIHRLDVVDAHEVEAEAVDVVFVDPVFDAFEHELAHHGFIRGSLVATA